jgi:hypothetical protein
MNPQINFRIRLLSRRVTNSYGRKEFTEYLLMTRGNGLVSPSSGNPDAIFSTMEMIAGSMFGRMWVMPTLNDELQM